MMPNSGPRWLISITLMPLPCQSSISLAASDKTSSGSVAGPAAKLNGRFIMIFFGNVVIKRVGIILDNALQAAQLGTFVEADQRDALRGAAEFAYLADAGAYQHTLV